MDVLEGLQQIRGEMDRYVVANDDVKEAVMLGLIAQEHIYLEGRQVPRKPCWRRLPRGGRSQIFLLSTAPDTRLAELAGTR
jgi:hypothetical protein